MDNRWAAGARRGAAYAVLLGAAALCWLLLGAAGAHADDGDPLAAPGSATRVPVADEGRLAERAVVDPLGRAEETVDATAGSLVPDEAPRVPAVGPVVRTATRTAAGVAQTADQVIAEARSGQRADRAVRGRSPGASTVDEAAPRRAVTVAGDEVRPAPAPASRGLAVAPHHARPGPTLHEPRLLAAPPTVLGGAASGGAASGTGASLASTPATTQLLDLSDVWSAARAAPDERALPARPDFDPAFTPD